MPILLAAALGATAGQADSLLARTLWLAALDREAELDLDSATVLYRAARDADPRFFPAQRDYILRMRERGASEALRRQYEGDWGEDPVLACYSAWATAPYGYPEGAAGEFVAIEAEQGSTLCTSLFLANLADRLTPARIWRPQAVRFAEQAVRLAPELAEAWDRYGQVLSWANRAQDAEAALRRAIELSTHPLKRVAVYMRLAELSLERGDAAAAEAIQRAVAAAVERDGRPGLKVTYLHGLVALRAGRGRAEWEALLREEAELARDHGAWSWELRALWRLCRQLDDSGDPSSSVECHDRVVSIADSVGSAAFQLRAYVKRGRALAHLGRLAEAERDISRGIALAPPSGASFWLADAYHNLVHIYEWAGRIEEASRIADRFVDEAALLTHSPSRMMSLRDAGMTRWMAGWHAAANEEFRQMVEVIDEQEENYHWAGEYLERAGDWQAALEYYRRAIAEQEVLSETWRALARVHDRLGQPDSAEAAARAHDELQNWGPLDTPLLADVQASRMQFEEATKTLRGWVEIQTGRGNLRGTAVANTRLGEMYLDWGKADSAAAAAGRADSLADRYNYVTELIHARRLKGEALVQSGEVGKGIAMLGDAAALAEAHPTAEVLLETQLALGRAFSRDGRVAEALEAYDRSASVIEETGVGLGADLQRVEFRSRNISPFDEALKLLLSAGRDVDPEPVLFWSQRRKSAALTLAALAHGKEGQVIQPFTLAEIRHGLTGDSALLDYVIIDSLSAVIVITPHEARVLSLPVLPKRLAKLVEDLRRPLALSYGGRIDLARAPFDLQLAGELYTALLMPIEPLLPGVRRVHVIPDGPLHYLPFAALVSRAPQTEAETGTAYAQARYLIDRFELVYLPSARFLGNGQVGVHRLTPASGSVLALAGDAPGAERELAAIEAAWSAGRVVTHVGDDATETRALTTAGNYSVVHLAAHAVADAVDPLASHVRLAPDEDNDGYLHLGEIAAVRRPIGLVVLSACETSQGRLYYGEGLMGLGRAFLAAGAESVVATLWPVGAASAELMGEFHSRLASGMSPAAALRAAQLQLRRGSNTAHPFFWAGFVLVGGAESAH